MQRREIELEASLRRLRAELASVESRRGRLPHPQQVDALCAAVQQARRDGALQQTAAAQEQQVHEKQRELQHAARRLPLWNRPWSELELLPLPSEATLQRFEHEQRKFDQRGEQLESQGRQTTEQIAELQQHQALLQRHGPVPAIDDLNEARQAREKGWLLLQPFLSLGPQDASQADPDAIAAYVQQLGGGDLPAAFARSVAACDELSDQLRLQADRVAEMEQLRAELEKARRRLRENAASQAQWSSEQEAWLEAWREAWKDCGISPLTPVEMRDWCDRARQIRNEILEMRKAERQWRLLVQQVDQHRQRIARRLDEIAADGAADGDAAERAAALRAWRRWRQRRRPWTPPRCRWTTGSSKPSP